MRARRRGQGLLPVIVFFAAAILVHAQQQPSTSSPLAKLPGALVERAAKTLRDGPTSITNFARFNDTLVSLAGDEGIPFATSYEPSTGEECAALCASFTARATEAAEKKGSKAPPPPRCFSAAFDVREPNSSSDPDDEKDAKKKQFTCALDGWSRGEACPEVMIETSGGTTSFLDPKALSSSLGACAGAAAAAAASSAASSSSSVPASSSSPHRATKSKQKTAAAAAAAAASSSLPADTNKEKADALGAIAAAVRSSLPPAPPDPAAAAAAASAAAASLASAASGGDDTAARAQAWAAVVDAKPGAAVAVVGARPPISAERYNRNAGKAKGDLELSYEYLGTATDVTSAAVCSGLCQQFVAGADNAGGSVIGVTEFGTRTVSGRAGYYGVSNGPLQAHCVAASFYDGDAALGIDPATEPDQSVGKVCDLFGVAPRGVTVLLLEPEETETKNGKVDPRSTVTFIRPQRWSELDYALED